MSDLSDIIRILPPMKSGSELLSALEVLPEYDAAICDADTPVRLMALSDLYRVYVPNQMCQRQFEIVRKRRRNFVVFRRGG